MPDTRQKNKNWRCADADGSVPASDARLAVLMDIRDELQAIAGLLRCYRIPRALDAVYAMHRDGVKRRVVRKRGRK